LAKEKSTLLGRAFFRAEPLCQLLIHGKEPRLFFFLFFLAFLLGSFLFIGEIRLREERTGGLDFGL
jgi:hypothetical protein